MNATVSVGIRQRKRARRATPPSIESSHRLAAGGILITFSAGCAVLYWQRGWWVWLLIAAPAVSLLIALTATVVYELGLLALAQLVFGRQGIRCVVVHSQSPNWKDHISARWLPRLGNAAVTLDWSRRARWGSGLRVALFHRFCGPYEFNPAVIVFRGLRRPHVFRFRRAFHEAKRGRRHYVHALEEQMFRAVECRSR
jgi:hypothetical protein